MQDRLPPFEQLETLRLELEDDFSGGIEERKRNKKRRIDEILEMLIIAYMFGNESGNYMLSGETAPTQDDEELPIPIRVDSMNGSIFRKIADKTWEERVSEYLDDEAGTVDEIIRVVDTDLNRVYNDSILDVGERADGTVMKTWQTMEDDRVRLGHEILDQVTIPVDKRFYSLDGDSARYPGDFANPALNVNCRCRLYLSYER